MMRRLGLHTVGRWTAVTTALATALALGIPGGALAAHASRVSGTVFNDYGQQGVQNTNASDGQVDNGIGGIRIKAFDRRNKLVGQARTDSSGHYTLKGLPAGAIRVEIEIPSPYQISEDRTSAGGTVKGATANTSSRLDSNERYLNDRGSPSGVNFGLEIPDQYSVPNPNLFVTIQWPLLPSQLSMDSAAVDPDIEAITYFSPGAGSPITAYSQTGSTSGLAVDQATGALYTSAFYSGLSYEMPAGSYPGLTHPSGAIYRVVPGPGDTAATPSLFADVGAGPSTTNYPTNYSTVWPNVGHAGWGAIATDPAGHNLYGVNLANHELYRFPLRGGTKNSTGQVQPARITAIPDPGCADGDWSPWALGFDTRTGGLYLGGVCTAATSQKPGDLHAYIDLVKDPSGKPSFKQVLSFGLNYNRIDHSSQKYPSGSGTTDPANSDWEPWPTTKSVPPATYPEGPSDPTRGTRTTPYGSVNKYDESYPAVSQLSFDSAGNMVIAVTDLMSQLDRSPATPQGDLLKACVNGKGGWTLESAGKCGSGDGFLPTVNGDPISGGTHGVDYADFGPIGPGNGHFFDPNDVYNQGRPDNGADRDDEPDPQLGGVLSLAGFSGVVNTQDGVSSSSSSPYQQYYLGLVWNNDFTGDYSRSWQAPTYGKATGLGDIAAFTTEAPVQIGNRVWRDLHTNCTEDAGDPGIGGVEINLLGHGGANLATATTNGAGEYTFSILRGTAYKLQIKMSQHKLKGLKPTCADKRGVDRRITSKGRLVHGRDTASVAPLAAGHTDFNYDFGFVRRAVKPARKHRPPPFTG